jgi:hypothetical protein
MGPRGVGFLGLAGMSMRVVPGGIIAARLILVIGGGGNRAHRRLRAVANSR